MRRDAIRAGSRGFTRSSFQKRSYQDPCKENMSNTREKSGKRYRVSSYGGHIRCQKKSHMSLHSFFFSFILRTRTKTSIYLKF